METNKAVELTDLDKIELFVLSRHGPKSELAECVNRVRVALAKNGDGWRQIGVEELKQIETVLAFWADEGKIANHASETRIALNNVRARISLSQPETQRRK